MLTRKSFYMTFSKKLSDGSIIVANFGTEFEADIDGDSLAKKVRASTYKDIKNACAEDTDIDFLVTGARKSCKRAKLVETSLEDMEELHG